MTDNRITIAMARCDTLDQVIALQTRPSATQEDERGPGANDHIDDFVEHTEQMPPRRADTRKRACVLLGSAILQFPIWGESLL
jgi:hypothetical protein